MGLSSKQLLDVVQALPDPVFILTETGRYAGVLGGSDPGYYHDGSGLTGASIYSVLPPEKAEEVMVQVLRSLDEDRLLKIEYQLAAAQVKGLEGVDGPESVIWFEGHVQPFPSLIDGERAVIWIARNISERKLLELRLREASLVDPLTGTFNRRKLMDELANRFAELRRYGHPCTFLMLDIDHFKRINDRFGHDAGDKVLQSVCQAFAQLLRDSDLLCRFGGEEFAILLPNTALGEAHATAERLRSAVTGQVAAELCQDRQPTVSIGVAEMRADDCSFEVVIRRADDAMYEAKRAGRNRVSVCAL